jgi:hypothetical protein
MYAHVFNATPHDESVFSNDVFAMVRNPPLAMLIVGLLVVGTT